MGEMGEMGTMTMGKRWGREWDSVVMAKKFPAKCPGCLAVYRTSKGNTRREKRIAICNRSIDRSGGGERWFLHIVCTEYLHCSSS